MRILLLHNRHQQGGGEDVVVQAEAELLDQHGHEVCLAEVDNADADGLFIQMKTAAEVVYSRRAPPRCLENCFVRTGHGACAQLCSFSVAVRLLRLQ